MSDYAKLEERVAELTAENQQLRTALADIISRDKKLKAQYREFVESVEEATKDE